jgi:hypothetical protein
LPQNFDRVSLDSGADLQKLNHVEPAFTALILGHE